MTKRAGDASQYIVLACKGSQPIKWQWADDVEAALNYLRGRGMDVDAGHLTEWRQVPGFLLKNIFLGDAKLEITDERRLICVAGCAWDLDDPGADHPDPECDRCEPAAEVIDEVEHGRCCEEIERRMRETDPLYALRQEMEALKAEVVALREEVASLRG